MNFRPGRWIVLATALVCLSACSAQKVVPNNQFNTRDYTIQLIPQGNNGNLRIPTASQRCGSNQHDGCMGFDLDTTGLIKFHLGGLGLPNKTCADENVDEVITGIQLTTTVDSSGGNGNKGDFTVLPDAWLKYEAFSSLDLSTGFVYQASVGNPGATQVWLFNANGNDAADGVKTFWYQVTAEACPGSNKDGPWVTDPRGENRGTGR